MLVDMATMLGTASRSSVGVIASSRIGLRAVMIFGGAGDGSVAAISVWPRSAMADLGQTEIAATEPSPAPPKIITARNPILEDAITPTLLRLAVPNIVAMSTSISVLIAETTYIGIPR